MIFGIALTPIWILTSVRAIDINERVGPCIPGFDVTSTLHITSNEGVWFPQYRNRQLNNKRYSCHTINERLTTQDDTTAIKAESYFTKDGVPERDAYVQTYTQEKRGVLVDREEYPGYGKYQVKNFIINMTPEYRVRYVCTDLAIARRKDGPVVYIETRSMTSSPEVIRKAVADIKKSGISVVLDRIPQSRCTRPLDPNGYPDSTENK